MPIPEFVVEIRRKIGHDLLWLPGVTAVVRRDDHLLMVQRADNLTWTPVTGCVDPGEEPATAAVREVLEETGVHVRVERLAMVSAADNWVTHPNGDQSVFLDLAFACRWLEGEPFVGDDESVDVRWWPLDRLPAMPPVFLPRIEAALSDEIAARFAT